MPMISTPDAVHAIIKSINNAEPFSVEFQEYDILELFTALRKVNFKFRWEVLPPNMQLDSSPENEVFHALQRYSELKPTGERWTKP